MLKILKLKIQEKHFQSREVKVWMVIKGKKIADLLKKLMKILIMKNIHHLPALLVHYKLTIIFYIKYQLQAELKKILLFSLLKAK
uniref:Uncharacterized protein n=1 Tax=Meloidogyne enterolobii TaxID=390850 RepID=A0A6V7XEZ6_MELEN|nr:unnamed protein product [Meloidogyne enterolobii]